MDTSLNVVQVRQNRTFPCPQIILPSDRFITNLESSPRIVDLVQDMHPYQGLKDKLWQAWFYRRLTMSESNARNRVLVVDDEFPMREMLREFLKVKGYECKACCSGDEALSVLTNEEFQVMISDLRMPGISGLVLLGEVHEKYPQMACLMATADGDIQNGIKAMKLGADDYLLKPFKLDAVLASVQKAMERKRLETELENYRRNLEDMVQQRTAQLRTVLKRIELTYDETLLALGAALDLRDAETEGH